jgi:hypothetical protein
MTEGTIMGLRQRRFNYRMPVLIWAGWAAPAAAEKKPAKNVTLENQLLLGKTFSYCTRLCSEKGGHESHYNGNKHLKRVFLNVVGAKKLTISYINIAQIPII